MKTTQLLVTCSTIIIACGANAAIDITPSFGDVPTGWATDRYEPSSFGNVGNYQGRADVLGIGITSAGNLANRPAAFQSSFYNTQGRKYLLSGGAGSILSADLWLATSMSNPANGAIRTDMWGTMTDGTGVSAYPIIGFANTKNADGSGNEAGRFQIYDDGIWITSAATVNYGAWNSLALEFTGSAFVYSINGSIVYTDNTVNGTTGFSEIIMQAYNFGQPSLFPNANAADYTAYWSNTPVPEPSTYIAGALLMLPFGASMIRKMRKA